jgi:PAS domain S-box-containing protein
MDQLRRFAALARAVSAAVKVEDALQEIAAAAAAVRPGFLAVIRVADRVAGGYRLAASVGIPPAPLLELLPFGSGLTHIVAETRQTIFIPDMRADPRTAYIRWPPPWGGGACYGLALTVTDEVLGTLVVFASASAPHTEEERLLLDLLAAQALVAIRNARQFGEIERRRQAAEGLAAVARVLSQSLDRDEVAQRVVQSVRTLLGVGFARLLRLDPVTGSLHTVAVAGHQPGPLGTPLILPPGTSVSGRAVSRRCPVVSRDILTDPDIFLTDEVRALFTTAAFRAVLSVPLLAQGRVVGTLSAGAEEGRAFGDEDVALMQAFADQAAVALNNARLHAEVARNEARYRAVVESQTELVTRRSPDGLLTFVNDAYCAFVGRERDALVDTAFHLEALSEERLDGEEGESPPGGPAGSSGRSETVERVRLPGGQIRWVQWSERDIVDETGTLLEVQSVGRDVSDHRRLEAQLFEARKMEAVGQLAAGLAHDVNNLLAIVMGHSHLLRDELAVGDARRRQAEEIVAAADQLASLTRQLLAFGRRQVLRPVSLDLGAVLADLQPMLRRVVPEDIDLRVRTGSPGASGRVTFDPTQLEDVVLKLVLNAREAMPRGGRLDVETSTSVLDEELARDLELGPGRYAMLTVRDDGLGMDQDTLDRLFEPFFTTKARGAGKGSGLGLAVVYGVVKQSGGHITVASAPGRGTEVAVYLPLLGEGARP